MVRSRRRKGGGFSLATAPLNLESYPSSSSSNSSPSSTSSHGGKTRHVPLGDKATAILRMFGSILRSAWVFPGLRDETQPMDSHAFLRRSFEPGLRKAGISGACWHTLRHTAASRRVMAGVDLVSVKEILGHRDIETTVRYAHLSPGHLRDALNRGSLSGT